FDFTSETDPTRLALLNTGNPINRDWRNTRNIGLGANYKFNDTWQARGGYSYYPKVIPTATWDPSIPEADQNAFTIGGTFTHSAFDLDFAYNYVSLVKRTINNSVGASSASTVNGIYKTNAQLVGVNLTYHFTK